MLKINEIFHSIQGESTFAGMPTVFVRLTGCNLRCAYCDTTYSYFEGEKQELDKILDDVAGYQTPHVCITGGEPLLQPECHELMRELCDRGHIVSLETSGASPIKDVDPRVKIILDVKTPDSGEADSFLIENLDFIRESTEIKFVICSEKDFTWAEKFSASQEVFEKNIVLYSPSFGKISEKWLAKKILSQRSKARLQLQLHKYIWSEHKRGI